MASTIGSTAKTTGQIDQEQQNTQQENRNHLTYDDEVIKKIAALATIETDGILGMSGSFFQGMKETFGREESITKGIRADVGEKQVAIDLEVYVEYGKSIPAIYKDIKESVARNIHQMTGLELVEFNMNVDDVFTREEFEENRSSSKSRPDSNRVE
ncbi:Asp23/Gls24 family envelope stress response protein [Bacillus sp. C1-1]|nr:Asp23/Gls24 family envelope stress response protein [Bacillus sp. C1-1]